MIGYHYHQTPSILKLIDPNLNPVANLVHHACGLGENELKEALIVSVLHELFNNIDVGKRKELGERLKNTFGEKIVNSIELLKMRNKGDNLMMKSQIFSKIYYSVENKDAYLLYILIADTISGMIKLIKQFPNAKYNEIDEYLRSLEKLVENKQIPKELYFMWNQKCEEVRRLFLKL